ncbi:unnamed protein product [Rotaria sordida]|uniref:Helix-turn-helix domain-containing protein n=2 Tax=Rotaria sordida TaxID=392033 RepID=A0A819M4G5_9BILA|nr:unnamed protein product [Rotaria sordida]
MLPQEESLAILAEFLRVHYCERVNGISIDTIVELGRVVLQANTFVYGNKFYRQIIGGAMGSAFTLTLPNIFMWKWERQTILPKLGFHEIYGRYIDNVFFKSNESEDKVKELLEAANNFHPNIKLEYHIGKSIPFLDVVVKNNNGILASSVYHKPSTQPTVVSFLSDHPRHVFRNVIHTALTRAVRYSSSFEVFNNERRAIRLMFLYNRLVVGFRNNPNIEFELSRKRPSSSILKDPLRKKGLASKTLSLPIDMETSSDPTLLLPDYLKLSDSKFTQMLLTSTSNIMNQDELIESERHITIYSSSYTTRQ